LTELLEYLDTHSDAFIVVFTAVVTISTVVYAILTAILVSETRKMREVQTEPKIHITIESFEFAINIVRLNIQNIGLGPARNLRFEPSVISGEESAENLLKEFTQSNFFSTGLRHFSPSQNIYSTFSDTTKDFEGKSNSVLSFKLSYESATGKNYSDEVIIDMSEIKGNYQLGKPSLYSISKSLEKMQKDVGHIVSGYKRVQTDVYSDEDRKNEEKEREKMFDEYKKQKNS